MELTIEQALHQGATALEKGKVQDAERIYRNILASQPLHPEANHNLGVIAVSVNKTDEALPLFKTALEINPKIEQFWLSYIDALIKEKQFGNAKLVIEQAKTQGVAEEKLNSLEAQFLPKTQTENVNSASPSQQQLSNLLEYYQNGRLDDAEKLAVSVTQEFPLHQFSWKVLGAVLKQTGKIKDSLGPMQKSVQLDPQDAEAHNNLGVALEELERLDEAESSYKKAIALNPNYAEAHNNLGNTFKELRRLDEAESSYKQAIGVKPDYAQAYYNLGVTLKELRKLDEAESSYKKAIALNPNYAEAHNNLGNTLKELRRLDEAVSSYKQAIGVKPDYAHAYYNLGVILKELRKLDEAESSYKKAIALNPKFAEAYNNLGVTQTELGRLKEAESSYTQAIALKPDYAEAHRHLTLNKKFKSKDEQYSKMLELYFDENISEEQRCNINFGLAKACEDLENFKQAFTHYSEGNQLRKKLLNYDINQDIELFNQIKSNYPQIEKNSLENNNFSTHLIPIFIVGMPRSGTTLVEQIISSHSLVTGAGELSFVVQYGTAIVDSTEVKYEALINFRNKYLKKIKNFSNGNLLVTDKQPQNFRYLGLLAAAFPEGKIIHVQRNPAALCWANYKQYFVSKNIGYCYEIDDIINYYKLYENLMGFWAKKLSKRIYNLDYEQLTINQESQTRQLIDYLGLDWDEKCLSPQNNKRSVETASNYQIREKVFQGSSQQWKKYKPFLNGALDMFL